MRSLATNDEGPKRTLNLNDRGAYYALSKLSNSRYVPMSDIVKSLQQTHNESEVLRQEQMAQVMDSLDDMDQMSEIELRNIMLDRIMSLNKDRVSRAEVPEQYQNKQIAKTNDEMIKRIVEFSFQLEPVKEASRRSRMLSADKKSSKSIHRSKSEIGLEEDSQNGDKRSNNSSLRQSMVRPASEISNGATSKLSKQEQKL